MPIYALYALWFADTGLTDGQISTLFIVWSAAAFVAEVPTGVLADRFSRRAGIVASGVVQAAGFAVWTIWPGYPPSAVGFVLWGVGGALVSGAFEALLYDGLAAVGEQQHYQRVLGSVTAVSLFAQVPAAFAASALVATGGYRLVGGVSVGVCLAASVLACRFAEPPRHVPIALDDGAGDEPGLDGIDDGATYLGTLREGLRTVLAGRRLRAGLIAVTLIGGLDGLEEYFPILAQDWHISVTAVPIATLGVPLSGALGAALGGRGGRLSLGTMALILAAGLALLAVAAIIRQPVGMVAAAVFYGVHQFVLVAVDAELQHRITGRARATVTSTAGFGTEVAAIGLFLGWGIGGLPLVIVGGFLIAVLLPRLLHR